jgi:hypothetical protein
VGLVNWLWLEWFGDLVMDGVGDFGWFGDLFVGWCGDLGGCEFVGVVWGSVVGGFGGLVEP